MKFKSLFLVLAAVVLLGAAPAWADMTAGFYGTPDVFNVSLANILADTGVMPYTGLNSQNNQSLGGQYRSLVVSDPSNVFCAGCLDFVYGASDTGGPDAIGYVTASSFGGFKIDAGVASNLVTGGGAGDIAPIDVSVGVGGVVVTWEFPGATGVPTGYETAVLVVETNATSWTGGTFAVIDSGTTNLPAFQPSVPEPATIVLLVSMLGVVGLGLRKRVINLV